MISFTVFSISEKCRQYKIADAMLEHCDNGTSSCSQMFFKTDVFKNFATFTGKNLYWSYFLMKLHTFRLLLKSRFLFLVSYDLLVTKPKNSAISFCCLRLISSF